MSGLLLVILILLVIATAGLGTLNWNQGRRHRRAARAIAALGAEGPALERLFLQQAQATGKPRGLCWTRCELAGDPVFARDRQSGEIVALVEATIGFEAIAGSDMEEVEAVGNLRSATVVFVFRHGSWTSDGRAVFNLNPAQALERFATMLARVDTRPGRSPGTHTTSGPAPRRP